MALQREPSSTGASSRTSPLNDLDPWSRVLAAAVTDAVLLADSRGRVTQLNDAAEALTGWTRQEALSLPLPTVLVVRNGSAEHADLVVEHAWRDGVAAEIEGRLIARDGAERLIAGSSTPVHDASGRTLGTVLVFREASSAGSNGHAPRGRSDELDDFFENPTIGMHWVGPDGLILRANRAELEMLGYDHDEYVGRHVAEFHADSEAIRDMLDRLKAGEHLHEHPARLRCKDGSIKDVLIDSSALFRDGRFVHTRCFTRDVTEQRRSTAAFREAHRLLQAVFNQQFQFMAILAPDGTVRDANETCFRLTGVRREEVLGRPIWAAPWWNGLPVMQERWREYVALAAQDVEPVVSEVDYSLADGTVRHATAVITGLRDDEGRVTALVVEGHDDTERRRDESALRQSEERLRLALDAGRMGVWDWNVQTGALSWSDSLEPLHGIEPGTFGGTFEHFMELVHPEDREPLQQAIGRALETRGEFYVEFRNPRRSGAVHWIAGSGKAFCDEQGRPQRMIGIGLDVTARKRSEQTARFLADASAALAGLVEMETTLRNVATMAVPHFADWSAVDVLDDEGTLRRVAVAHVDPAKVQLAEDLHRRFPPDPTAPTGVWNILRTGQSELVPVITDEMLVESVLDPEMLQILRQLGLRSYLAVPISLRGQTRGVLTFIVAESDYVYDETDLAVAQDLAHRAAIAIDNARLYHELREGDRRKDEFLATLAHELRNPLAPIRTGLEVLRMAENRPEIAADARAMMDRQLAQLVRLVDDLLDVSRITRSKLELRKERVTLAEVVECAVETSRPLIEQARHRLTVDLPVEPVPLDADVTRLAQVFSNLLNNSAKYTEAGGSIVLAAERTGNELVVRVRDDGIGIPAEALPHVFTMFAQVDRHRDRTQGGLGIGLTLVRRLVEMHGGAVEARSEGPGQGSEFVVRLPIAQAAPLGVPRSS
jgi:PAS domain S-box-containing protein